MVYCEYKPVWCEAYYGWNEIWKSHSKIGKNCVIGGQVGIAGHIKIGDNVKIQGQTGVISNIKENATIQGTPAFSYSDYSKSYVHFKNLPNLVKEINRIVKKLDQWQKKNPIK